jgi:hypothetical protein
MTLCKLGIEPPGATGMTDRGDRMVPGSGLTETTNASETRDEAGGGE